jgi:hypothetical protein
MEFTNPFLDLGLKRSAGFNEERDLAIVIYEIVPAINRSYRSYDIDARDELL